MVTVEEGYGESIRMHNRRGVATGTTWRVFTLEGRGLLRKKEGMGNSIGQLTRGWLPHELSGRWLPWKEEGVARTEDGYHEKRRV